MDYQYISNNWRAVWLAKILKILNCESISRCIRKIPLTALPLPHNSYRPHFVPVRDKRDGEKTLCWKLLQIISLTDGRRGRGGHRDEVFVCGHDVKMLLNNIPYGQSSAKLPVTRSLGHFVTWSVGHSITRSFGHSVIWSLFSTWLLATIWRIN